MIDWKEVKILYDQLMDFRGRLSVMSMADSKLEQIAQDAYDGVTDQLAILEAYLAPFRENKTGE